MMEKTFIEWIKYLPHRRIHSLPLTQQIQKRLDHVLDTTGYFIRTPYPKWEAFSNWKKHVVKPKETVQEREWKVVEKMILGDEKVSEPSIPLCYFPKVDSHKELIICPNCDSIEIATVEHTFPWASFVHECVECKNIIMESEWNRAEDDRFFRNPNVPAYWSKHSETDFFTGRRPAKDNVRLADFERKKKMLEAINHAENCMNAVFFKKGQCPKFAQQNPNHNPVDSFNC